MQRTRTAVFAALLLSGFLHAAQPAAASPSTPPSSSFSSLPVIGGGELVAHDVVEYATAVQTQEVADYVVAVQAAEYAAAQAQLAAYLEAMRPPPPPVQTTRPNPTNLAPQGQVQGVCGGATNGADQFIQRESGGNPNALNPSGAWGCYQIMPGTWAGAGCNELGAYGSADASTQAACASRLGLSAWNL